MRLTRRCVHRHPHYLKGVFPVIAGGVFISQSGVIIGSMQAAGFWQVQFFRSVVAILVLFSLLAVRHHGNLAAMLRSSWKAAMATAVFLAVSNLLYILAFFHTRAASVFFIISSQPFFTALIAWVVLREPVRRTTWLAMSAAMAGVAIMMGEGLGKGRLLGDLVALGAAVTFAAFGVSLRSGRGGDMVLGVVLASCVISIVSVIFVDSFRISTHDFILCLYMGCFQVAMALALLAAGARYVPAAELMVPALTEVILGPLWVWLVIGESPTVAGFIGASIVIGAVLANALSGIRSPR